MEKTTPTTDAVWSQLSSDLWRFIRRRVPDDHVADDLHQETFLRIHRKIGTLGDADRLAAWVYQIARNVIHDHYRMRGIGESTLGEHEPADEPGDELAELRRCAGGWLDGMIAQLPDGYREAVRLAELENQTGQDVANRLGLSLAATKSRIRRGRLMLRERLDACCQFDIDRRGNVIDYERRSDRAACQNCDC